MRIGFDASILGRGGGIETYVKGFLAALRGVPHKHSLVLWCGSRSNGPAVRRLAPPGSVVIAPDLMGRLLDRLGRLGWASPFTIEALVGPVDVFHGPNYFLPAQRGQAALLITVHDLSALRYPDWHPARRTFMHRMALRQTARAVNHVITDTEAIRAEVMEYLGVPPERVTAIHLAVAPGFRLRRDPELKLFLDRWGLLPGEYLLFAGAIEPRKNLIRLLEAISFLQQRRPDVPPLILAGPPGWRNQEIYNRVAAAGPGVRYVGYLAGEELAALMAGCAVFVMPSLYEGFGLPVLEAMTCGVPVVTSRGGALEEVAGDAAILVDPLDIDEIAAGIEKVLDDTALREAMVEKGLARAAQFSWERTARETLRIYEQAIESKR